MLNKPATDIEIIEDAPFVNDKFSRENEIVNLTNMLNKFQGPIVLSLNSPWGTGKTTFARLWLGYLKQQKQSGILLNAWESDYAEDPLIPLVSAINDWILNHRPASKIKEQWKKAKAILPILGRVGASMFAKIAIHQGLDFTKEIEKAIADGAGEIAGDLVDTFNQKSQAIELFKDSITKILEDTIDDGQKLYIFIDELDRCRPTYAIELLERIKHLFNLDKVVFILSTDFEQLSHSICAVYGNNFDARKYLDRFIDLDYSIKEPDIEKYVNSLFGSLAIDTLIDDPRKEYFLSCCCLLIRRFGLKLRDINQYLMRLRLILGTQESNRYDEAPLVATLLILKLYAPKKYEDYIHRPELTNNIIAYIKENLLPKDFYSHAFELITANLLIPSNFYGNEKIWGSLLKPFEQNAGIPNPENIEEADFAERILELVKTKQERRRMSNLKEVISRVELTTRISL